MIDASKATVLGGGAWGTALAIHLARIGLDVGLWMKETDLVDRMRQRHDNPLYLPGIRIPRAVRPTNRPREALGGADLVLTVVPAQFAREVYERVAPHVSRDVPVVVACKGIEASTLALPLEVASQTFGGAERLAVLSGPSFAQEFARESPTTIVVAATDDSLARGVQDRLSGANLRLYSNNDPVGVQVAGALKNVYAIAAGVVDGLGMGHNSLAALMTRGVAEMTRLGVALGGRAATFSGLAGLGDLVVTCTGGLSRNRAVGDALGRGERLQDVLARMRSVAEGVVTTRSARDLARRVEVEMPIVEEVYRVLHEDGSPTRAVTRLMSRPLKAEDEDPEGASES